MLSKLLKYEVKATGRIFLPLFLALLLFATITRIIFPLNSKSFETPAMISMIIYIVLMVGMFVMTFIMMVQRFYRSLLSDEGYLMLTLPVKPWKHIASKLLVSMLWVIASVIVAFFSVLIIALRKGELQRIIQKTGPLLDRVFDDLGGWIYLLSLEVIIGILISLASGILLIYASITIGHLFSQFKVLASFGAFIVLNTLSQILFIVLSWLPRNAYIPRFEANSHGFLEQLPLILTVIGYGIFYGLLVSSAYFAVTHFILNKRLNLE
jgi:hypothetical protein